MNIIVVIMMPAAPRKVYAKKPRFPGICEFAKRAGVHRLHAYRVLTGERQSLRLVRLWQEFQHQRQLENISC
ncbi:MAG: hypothetical protein LBK76_07655 [Verrucomicrobiales bacterium]|nr:hypothetical protein [Verrucomicrobiales bacterium]